MAEYLQELTYKPGINRDNTTFQSDYCNDGQWIRFNQGRIKKIGGVKSPKALEPNEQVTSLYTESATKDNHQRVYICGEKIIRVVLPDDFNTVFSEATFNIANLPENLLWQTLSIVDDSQRKLLLVATNNSKDISQDTKCKIFTTLLSDDSALITELSPIDINNNISGGAFYFQPFLFLYGENGLIQYSVAGNPLDFSKKDNTFNLPGSEKVIYCNSIRGGSNTFSLLFWTLSKVIRVSNVSENVDTPDFQINVVSNNSSILSSRSVVEFDGLYFWAGTDKFYVYNGVVQDVANDLNINYFFDNIDMNNKQKVFATIDHRYNEIWWFYPEKGQDENNVQNTRALIYNKKENTWYDTEIRREAGIYSPTLGTFLAYGEPFSNIDKFLWKHEVGFDEEVVNGDLFESIVSSFTTPVLSVTISDQKDSNKGVDRFLEIRRIEPDFRMRSAELKDQAAVSINTRRYAQSIKDVSDEIFFVKDTEKIDVWAQGRLLSLTFTFGNEFEVGTVLLTLSIGDGN